MGLSWRAITTVSSASWDRWVSQFSSRWSSAVVLVCTDETLEPLHWDPQQGGRGHCGYATEGSNVDMEEEFVDDSDAAHLPGQRRCHSFFGFLATGSRKPRLG